MYVFKLTNNFKKKYQIFSKIRLKVDNEIITNLIDNFL